MWPIFQPSRVEPGWPASASQGKPLDRQVQAEIDNVVEQRERLEAQMQTFMQMATGAMQQHGLRLQTIMMQVQQARRAWQRTPCMRATGAAAPVRGSRRFARAGAPGRWEGLRLGRL